MNPTRVTELLSRGNRLAKTRGNINYLVLDYRSIIFYYNIYYVDLCSVAPKSLQYLLLLFTFHL